MAKFLKPADGNIGLTDLSKLPGIVPDPCAIPDPPPLPPVPPGWGGRGMPREQWNAMFNAVFNIIGPAERRNWAAIRMRLDAVNFAANILNERGEIDVNNLFVANTATIQNASINDAKIAFINGLQFIVDMVNLQVIIGQGANNIVLQGRPNISATAVSSANVQGTTTAFAITSFVNTSHGGGQGSSPTTATNPRGFTFLSGDILGLTYNAVTLAWEVSSVHSRGILGKTDGAISSGGSGTISIYAGTPGSESDTGVNITAYSPLGALSISQWVWIHYNGAAYYVTSVTRAQLFCQLFSTGTNPTSAGAPIGSEGVGLTEIDSDGSGTLASGSTGLGGAYVDCVSVTASGMYHCAYSQYVYPSLGANGLVTLELYRLRSGASTRLYAETRYDYYGLIGATAVNTAQTLASSADCNLLAGDKVYIRNDGAAAVMHVGNLHVSSI